MKSNRYPIIGLIVILFAGLQTGFCDGYKDARKELEHNSRPWFVKDHIQRALQDNSSSFYYEDIQPEIDKFLSDYENQKQLPFESMIHEIEPFLQGSVSKELQQKSTSGDFDELFSKDVTLETVVSLVYARSPYIQSANSAFQAVLERYPQAVYLEGILQQYNAFTKRLDLLLGGMQLHKQMVDSDFPFPGMTALRGDIVQTDIGIAKQEYAITVRDVFANAKTAFYELVYIQRSIEITRENQTLLEQLLHVASQKFEAGNTTYNDVIQARVALAKLSNNLITQQNQQQTLRTNLNSLMNRLPGAPFGHAIQPDESKANLQLEPLYQLAKQNRQEIKKAELLIQRITQMIEMARIKNRPEPTTGTSYFLDRNALLAGSEKDYEAFQPVPMQQIRPWFGQRESFIAEMLEQKQEMQSKLKSVINQTEYEVKEAHFTLDKAQREVSLYQTTLLDDARQSLEIAESDYLGARIDFLDYLTAQQNWHDFNLSYYMAQRDVGIAKVKLERVIGSSLHQALSDTQP